ncbi:MAG TPA: L-aspartate oxidase [Candidatus Dormibacteraeota bacterium]|nr:L-aspartate oxidase [Candidatus Dormibacteraeota bacterium]
MGLPVAVDSTQPRFDLVVVGSGIAGLFAAVKGAHAGLKVAVLTKATMQECSSRYAQGGIAAAVDPDDSPVLHAADTVAAGRGLCDPLAVAALVEEGPGRIRELIELGVHFDTQDGVLLVAKEAAHSRSRIVHAGGDATGKEVEELLALRATGAVELILEEHLVRRLLISGGSCWGVEAISMRRPALRRLEAGAVLLATGGLGRLYRYTTNPQPSTGDGVWLGYQAGAEIAHLEFVQFHPTALALPGAPPFLISEAVRGEGALVVDDLGERFLFQADPAGELAGRDVVARAITERMAQRSLDNVWLDLRPMGAAQARVRFPNIVATCAGHGIDITKQPIPVAPAAHYQMGGVRTDLSGATTVPGLFAAGEVASTGVHGANRLASNSLLESLVFAARAVESVLGAGERARLAPPEPVGHLELEGATSDQLGESRRQLQETMWSGAGIVRDREGLAQTSARLAHLTAQLPESPVDPHLAELRGMLGTSALLAEAANFREESRGAHFRGDHPAVESRFLGTVVQKRGTPLEFRPIGQSRPS